MPNLRSIASGAGDGRSLPAKDDVIAVKHLWKAFYDSNQESIVVAISDVSVNVKRGQFVCICGPSGCGKSTLIRILAGLENKTLGEIGIEPTRSGSERPPAMVFQEASLFPWLTIEENVAYPLRLQGASAAERDARTRELLEVTRLTDFAKSYPHQLSGGMKQRASVARALVDNDSDILLMDEPFGALDEQTRIELQQELLRIWEQTGKTVLFITHSVEEAVALGDRVIVMSARPGEIVADINVPFPRPRDVLDLRRQPQFGQLIFDVWQLLARSKTQEKGVSPLTKETAEGIVSQSSSSPKPTAAELERLSKPSWAERVVSVVGKFSPLLVLVLWELLTQIGTVDPRFFPSPSSIASVFWQELVDGTLLVDTLATLKRVAIGFVAGGVPAIILGLVLGLWPTARQLIAPIFSALYPVPKIATFPLLLLILGVGEAPKYTIIAIVVFFLVFFNTLTGVRYAPRIYLDVAQNLGSSTLNTFRLIALPAALPSIFTGLRLGLGTGFVVIAAVEFVGARSGLGYAIWSSWQIFAVEKMYVNIIAISLLGYLCILLLEWIEYVSMPWSRGNR